MRTQLGIALWTSLFLCLPFAGCDDDETGDGTGGSGGGTSGYTLATVCTDLPPLICAQRESCCTDSGLGYDEAGCIAYEQSECEANVADVNAGLMTFDATSIDACLAGMEPNLAQCYFSLTERQSILDDYLLCQTIFEGQVAAGDACERDAQCAQPGGSKWTVCQNDVCTEMETLSAGAACTMGGENMTAFCDTGLYCDVGTISGPPPWTGTCATATPVGDPCDTTALVSLECGLGAYCDAQGSGNCEAAKPAGADCQTPLECESMDCPAGGGQCGDVPPLVDDQQCNG